MVEAMGTALKDRVGRYSTASLRRRRVRVGSRRSGSARVHQHAYSSPVAHGASTPAAQAYTRGGAPRARRTRHDREAKSCASARVGTSSGLVGELASTTLNMFHTLGICRDLSPGFSRKPESPLDAPSGPGRMRSSQQGSTIREIQHDPAAEVLHVGRRQQRSTWPAAASSRAIYRPRKPVAPVTPIRIPFPCFGFS